MAWRVIGRLMNPANATQCRGRRLESCEVLLQGCGIAIQEQEMLDVDGGRSATRTISTDDRYIQLTAPSKQGFENATQLQRQLLLATGRRVSRQTANVDLAYHFEYHFDGPKVCRRDIFDLMCHPPYAGSIGYSFVFQDDNADRIELVWWRTCEAETIQRMEWPARAPLT
ncbi:hypothetical protein TNCV_532081 [Trichonephila clavipes]|nr:hypothetical protein TNCV_532081 [Trichonephila clavipes]